MEAENHCKNKFVIGFPLTASFFLKIASKIQTHDCRRTLLPILSVKCFQPGLFFVYFQAFLTNITIFTTNICEKNVHPVYGAGIWTHHLQIVSLFPYPLDQGSRLSAKCEHGTFAYVLHNGQIWFLKCLVDSVTKSWIQKFPNSIQKIINNIFYFTTLVVKIAQ